MFRSRSPRAGGLRHPGAHAGPFLDEFCQDHGWAAHVTTHESAHAVAAFDRGVGFSAVTVVAPEHWADPNRRGIFAGGVELREPRPTDPSDLVLRRFGLEIAVAGSLAETRAYGHYLPGSFDGDLGFWRRRFDLAVTSDTNWIDDATGEPFTELVERMQLWVGANADRIDAVASELHARIEHAVSPERALQTEWSLSAREVELLVS